MLYHYFGSKEQLYLAALERVYERLRSREERLDLLHLDPVEGMAALVDFTFDHMAEHQEFIRLIGNENLLKGRYLKKSKYVPRATLPLVEAIENLLQRGAGRGRLPAQRRPGPALHLDPVAGLRPRLQQVHPVDHLRPGLGRWRLADGAARPRPRGHPELPAALAGQATDGLSRLTKASSKSQSGAELRLGAPQWRDMCAAC